MPGVAFSDNGDKAEATISAKIIDLHTQLSYSLQLHCIQALATCSTALALVCTGKNPPRRLEPYTHSKSRALPMPLGCPSHVSTPSLCSCCSLVGGELIPSQVLEKGETAALLRTGFTQSPSATEVRISLARGMHPGGPGSWRAHPVEMALVWL